jgi:hypothetical protein
MSGPILGGFVLSLFLMDKKRRNKRVVWLMLGSGVLALLLMAPLAAPLVRDQLARDSSSEVDVLELEGVTDLLAYVIRPGTYNYYWRDREFRLPLEYPYQNIAASFNYVPFIGYLTLFLAVYGAIRRWRQALLWVLLAAAYFLLALGSTLTIDAVPYAAIPMPYRLLLDSVVDVLIRRPHRLNLFLSLPVAMLVTWAMVDIRQLVDARFERWKPWLATVVTVAMGLIILGENPIRPFPTTSTEIPEWYDALAEEPGEFGIVELPTYERGFDKLYMFYQTHHGKPISGGHVSRLPAEADAFRESVPFLRPMLTQDSWLVQPEQWVDFAEVDVTRQLRQLAEGGIRYVVINKSLLNAGNLQRWQDWVTIRPIYEDEMVLVYGTAPELGEAFDINQSLGEGIGFIQTAYQPKEANQGGRVKVDVRWAAESMPAGDYWVCFALVDDKGSEEVRACQEIAEGFPTSKWQENEVVRGSYVIEVEEDLAPGDYQLVLYLAEDGEQVTGKTAVLGPLQVHPFQPEHDASICWERELCLRGYDLVVGGNSVELTPYWQARQALEDSYKLFVHLVDLDSGAVVAQVDTIPREWMYPTDIWEAGEIVRDPIVLNLDSATAGDYAILLGWYNIDSGERLRTCPEGQCEPGAADVYEVTELEVTE